MLLYKDSYKLLYLDSVESKTFIVNQNWRTTQSGFWVGGVTKRITRITGEGGVQDRPKLDYVICEWSLIGCHYF